MGLRAIMAKPLWYNGMTADGATATQEQLHQAWAAFEASLPAKARTLELALTDAGVTGTNQHYPTHRLADRMIQKARKAKLITYSGGVWVRPCP